MNTCVGCGSLAHTPQFGTYGDSMILAVCIFSQSTTGEVSSAYFRKLADFSGWGVQIFANGPPTETRLEGEEEDDEEEEDERW